jgi:hypothetical protein
MMKSRRAAVQAPRTGHHASRQPREVEAAYPLMPQQYYDLIARRHLFDGELRLLFAVLEDAIRCYVMNMKSASAGSRKEFEEARVWLNTHGHQDLFSFETLCALFEIEPDKLRKQLDTLCAADLPRRRLRSIGRRVPMSVPG